MPTRVRYQQWTRQPESRLDLNWANPHARGIVFAWDAGLTFPFSLLDGERAGQYRVNSGATPNTAQVGRSLYITGANTDNLRWGDTSTGRTTGWGAFSGATETTVEILFRPRNTTQTPHTLGSWNINTGNHWLVQQNGAGLIWVPAEDGSANRSRWDASGIFTANQWTRLLLSWRGSGSASMWIDGVNRTSSLSAVITAATTIRANPSELRVGSNGGGTPDFDIAYVRMWRRGMSDEEAGAYQSTSPWQLFAPRRLLVPVAAGGGIPTLSAATVFAITANSAQPRVTVTF